MSDTAYLESIKALIRETEGKLQNAMKDGRYANGVENMKAVLKYLREKQKELENNPDEKNNSKSEGYYTSPE